jgi:RNA polymerase sigma factor (sigma-70 family)
MPGGEAAEALFRAHYAGLVDHLAHLLGDRATAEDISQEAFLRVLRHPPRDPAQAGPWLRTVGRRLAFNYVRGERRRRAREDRMWRDPAMGPAPGGASDPTAGRDEADALRLALGALAPRDRLALLLRSSGCGYAEIAAAIAVRPSSVGTILARAARRLRAEYFAASGSGDPAQVLPAGGLHAHDALP